MQLVPINIRKISRWAEYVYFATLLFVLTQGPVLSVWFASEQQGGRPAIAPQLATYFLAQIPALVLVSRQKFTRRDICGPLGLLALLCIWLLVSTLWATNSQQTSAESISLLTTFICGVYFAKQFNLVEKLTLIVAAMQLGLLLSRLSIAQNWDRSKSVEGYWVGIYFNRNSLAPVAMISVVSALALTYVVYLNKTDKFRRYKLCLLVDIVIFGFVIALRTHSNTPFGGLIAFVGVYVFWEAFRRTALERFLQGTSQVRTVFATFVSIVAICALSAIRFQSKVLEFFGETLRFNGRSEIWTYSWNGFLEKPLLGWGWMSAWRSWSFMRMDLWWTVEGVAWSHSAFLDLLLGGGVLALGVFALAVVWGLYQIIPLDKHNPIESWSSSFVFLYLAMCTQESFIIGNHFLWMLFVAVLTSTSSITNRQDQSSTV